MPYKSVIESLQDRANELKGLVQQLGNLSAITDLNATDRNHATWGDDSIVVIVGPGQYVWDELSEEGKQVQHRLNEEYTVLRDIVRTMIRGRVRDVQGKFEEANRSLTGFVEHAVAGNRTVAENVRHNIKHLDDLVKLITEIGDASDRRIVLVPDTNALLYNPKIEDWTFPDALKFRFVITPTVLSELDQQKINHRVESVRDKAERIIRQLKEYQRRGRLDKGVTIRAGVSELVAIPTEPVMSESLSWLDETSNDDRLIASTIEVMRQYPHSPVVLVTRDINVQNKANMAGIPFDEPPESKV